MRYLCVIAAAGRGGALQCVEYREVTETGVFTAPVSRDR